jgi:energy-coupling factor transporter ATP-binding protein EcfA2
MIRIFGCEVRVGRSHVALGGESALGSRPVLWIDQLEIDDFEYVAVVGPNGSGKSMFLQLLAGLRPPATGHIAIEPDPGSPPALVEGEPVPPGIVFESPDDQIVGGTTALDLAFGLECRAEPPERIRAAVDDALRSFDLERLAKRPPHLMSEGEKQRLSLASAMIVRPSLLLLDEPTSRLDPDARRDFLGRLAAARRASRTTIVHVTHRSQEFMEADRILGLLDGRIAFDGVPGEFLASPDADRFQPIWSPLHRFRRRLIQDNVPLDPPAGGRWNDLDGLLGELLAR